MLPGARGHYGYNIGKDKPVNRYTPEELEVVKKRYSDKRLNQTDKDYFEAIDKAIEDLGLDREKIKKMNEEILNPDNFGDISRIRLELLKYIEILFDKLVEDGYNPDDLNAPGV